METIEYLVVITLIIILGLIVLNVKKKRKSSFVSIKEVMISSLGDISKKLSDPQVYVLSKVLNSEQGQIRYLQVYNVYKAGLTHETLIKKTREDVSKINSVLIDQFELDFDPLLTLRDKNDKRNRVVVLNPLCDIPSKNVNSLGFRLS